MSDEAPPALTPAITPAKSSKAVLGLLVLNLGATGFVAFKLLTAHPVVAAAGHGARSAEAAPASETMGPIVSLDPFVVNLDEPGTSRYLKVTIQVEVAPKSEEVLVKSKELVRDAVLSHLSGLRLKDTLGAEAKDRLRQDLIAKINKLIGAGKARRMFFQDFVVQ